MAELRLVAPSRLHFGLLAYGSEAPRRFGGLGLMVERPGLELSARPSAAWSVEGGPEERVLELAARVAEGLAARGVAAPPTAFEVRRAPAEHVGLGSGTQLGLAVARLVATLAGLPDLPATDLARLAGRGLRSGVGLHGFALGGLIVDGGHRGEGGLAPLVARADWPEAWHVLLVIPGVPAGLHGEAERRAFGALPAVPLATTERLCRLILLGVLPAVVEHDLEAFGAALGEIQAHVGRCFAPAQGGPFAHPELRRMADWLRSEGLRGVGQSSWGPTLYGFTDDDPSRREAIARRARERFGLDGRTCFWTTASPAGARLVPAG
jgi:beta-RFAP synthase